MLSPWRKLAQTTPAWWPNSPNTWISGTTPLKLFLRMPRVVQLQDSTRGFSGWPSWNAWDGRAARWPGSFLWSATYTKRREVGRQRRSLWESGSCLVCSANTTQIMAMWILTFLNLKLRRHFPISHSKPAVASTWFWICKEFIWTRRTEENPTWFWQIHRWFRRKSHLDQVIWELKGWKPSSDLIVVGSHARSWAWTRIYGRKARERQERTGWFSQHTFPHWIGLQFIGSISFCLSCLEVSCFCPILWQMVCPILWVKG